MSGRSLLAGITAIFAAATAGILAFALFTHQVDLGAVPFMLVFAVPIAVLHCVFLAAPLYTVMVDRWPLRWWNAGLAGFVIGAIPLPFFMATLSGWEVEHLAELPLLILWFGGSGLAGGLAFRAVRGPRPVGMPGA